MKLLVLNPRENIGGFKNVLGGKFTSSRHSANYAIIQLSALCPVAFGMGVKAGDAEGRTGSAPADQLHGPEGYTRV